MSGEGALPLSPAEVLHLFDNAHEHCGEDETCLRTTVAYCNECGLHYCSDHIEGEIHGRTWCKGCWAEYEAGLEQQYGGSDYDGPRWGQR